MIIGNGLLGACFRKHEKKLDHNVVIFASGVSNSSEISASEFDRELDLLYKYISKSFYIVYFSTCSIFDETLKHSQYVQHKLNIEKILNSRGNALIIRLPQLVGYGGNKHTLLNFLSKNIESGSAFDVWVNAKRSLIDVDDVVYFTFKLIEHFIPNFCLINLAAPRTISIIELVNLIEKSIGKTANYRLVNAGSDYFIDVSQVRSLFSDYSLIFHDDYFDSIVMKYLHSPTRSFT